MEYDALNFLDEPTLDDSSGYSADGGTLDGGGGGGGTSFLGLLDGLAGTAAKILPFVVKPAAPAAAAPTRAQSVFGSGSSSNTALIVGVVVALVAGAILFVLVFKRGR